MLEVFALDGGFTVGLGAAPPSLEDDVSGDLTLRVYLKNKVSARYDLTADSAQAVSFGGCASAGVVVIRSTGKVQARLTSADGSLQAVPVDGTLVLVSGSVPFTAIDLTRVSGVETLVQVTLGEVQ